MSPHQRAEQRSRKNYLVVALTLLFAGVSVAMVQYKIPGILGNLMTTYDMTSSTASWLMSIFTVSGIFLSLPTGSLVRKFGPKTMMLAGCAVIIAGSIIGAFSTSAWLLIASRAIEGIAFVFISVAGPLAVDKFVEAKRRGTANGIWALWICIGSFIGSTATPMALEALGLSWTWIAYAAVVALSATILAIVVRVPRGTSQNSGIVHEHENGKGLPCDKKEEGDEKASIQDYAALLRSDSLLFFFAWLVFNIEILAVLSYTPTFLQSQGMNASLSGFASSLPGLLAAVSSLAVGRLVDVTGKTKPFFIISMAVMGPAAFLMLTQSGFFLWVGALLMGLVGYGAAVACLAALPQIAHNQKMMAAVTGCYALVMCLGEFLGSLITPMLLGPDLGNWTFCGIVMLGLGIAGTVSIALCKFK